MGAQWTDVRSPLTRLNQGKVEKAKVEETGLVKAGKEVMAKVVKADMEKAVDIKEVDTVRKEVRAVTKLVTMAIMTVAMALAAAMEAATTLNMEVVMVETNVNQEVMTIAITATFHEQAATTLGLNIQSMIPTTEVMIAVLPVTIEDTVKGVMKIVALMKNMVRLTIGLMDMIVALMVATEVDTSPEVISLGMIEVGVAREAALRVHPTEVAAILIGMTKKTGATVDLRAGTRGTPVAAQGLTIVLLAGAADTELFRARENSLLTITTGVVGR